MQKVQGSFELFGALHSACFQVKPVSTDGYEIDGGSRLENISDLFDRILAPYKVKRKIDSTIR